MRKKVKGLTLNDDKFDTLITSLKHHIQPIKNIALEGHKDVAMEKDVSEDIGNFLFILRRQSVMRKFDAIDIDTIQNQVIGDQFIRGLKFSKITENWQKKRVSRISH